MLMASIHILTFPEFVYSGCAFILTIHCGIAYHSSLPQLVNTEKIDLFASFPTQKEQLHKVLDSLSGHNVEYLQNLELRLNLHV